MRSVWESLPRTVSKLVNAEESISKETAHKLAKLSGVSMQTWLNLQNIYDVKVAEIIEQREFDQGLREGNL